MFVDVQQLKESPAAISVHKLCEENGYSYECHPGPTPCLFKNGRRNECKTDHHSPSVVPGVQTTEHLTKALGDRKQAQAVGDHERSVETKLPERLQSNLSVSSAIVNPVCSSTSKRAGAKPVRCAAMIVRTINDKNAAWTTTQYLHQNTEMEATPSVNARISKILRESPARRQEHHQAPSFW